MAGIAENHAGNGPVNEFRPTLLNGNTAHWGDRRGKSAEQSCVRLSAQLYPDRSKEALWQPKGRRLVLLPVCYSTAQACASGRHGCKVAASNGLQLR